MVRIYNGTLLSHKKERIGVSSKEVDEPRSKLEGQKHIFHFKADVCNLERWYR